MKKTNRWCGRPSCGRKAVLALAAVLLSLLAAVAAGARETISMYVGEVRVLEMGGIERVAIGNPKVASNSILPQGQLVVLADADGVTTMHIWLKDGGEKDFDIRVTEKRALDNHQELVRLLAGIDGVTVDKVGDVSVVRGTISLQDKVHYDRVISRYGEVLDLVTARDTLSDISMLLDGVPGISVREIGGNPVITGEVSSEYGQLIKIVEGKYPNVLNLTRVHEAVAGKMVYMKVRIMEVTKTLTENLGIDWDVLNIAGPSFEFGWETRKNGSTIINNSQQKEFPQSLKKTGNTNLTSGGAGYFGIATGIGSLINLAESTGDAVTLAEPRLSTRSGGSAEFLAGGEYPVPTSNSLGATNVEFKKYGISLDIQPVVDDRGNILAHVETEISNIDEGVAVNLIPGVSTRRTSTDVSLRDGQTLVIAGLVQDLAHKNFKNVKWLSDMPVLGPLFSSEDFKNQKTELVIFITPTIYDAASAVNAAEVGKGEEIENHLQTIIEGKKLLD